MTSEGLGSAVRMRGSDSLVGQWDVVNVCHRIERELVNSQKEYNQR